MIQPHQTREQSPSHEPSVCVRAPSGSYTPQPTSLTAQRSSDSPPAFAHTSPIHASIVRGNAIMVTFPYFGFSLGYVVASLFRSLGFLLFWSERILIFISPHLIRNPVLQSIHTDLYGAAQYLSLSLIDLLSSLFPFLVSLSLSLRTQTHACFHPCCFLSFWSYFTLF